MLVLLLLVPLVLLGSVELLYRYALSRVGELPRAPVARMDFATRALWAATEKGPLQLEPRWPWTLVAEFAHVSRNPRHERTAGVLTSSYVASRWMTSRPGHESTPMRNWHLRELALSMWISRHWTVEELLTAYAEGSRFGWDIIGLDAAARRYFGKAPGQLALHEAALLAGLPQSPARYDPFCQPERALQRRNAVLSRLQGLGWISQAQGEEARKQPLLPAAIAANGAGACAH